MKTKAFTLIETLVYLGLFCLVGMLVATIFFYMNRTQQATTATYAVTGEADTAIQTIRRDLEETALGSIRLDPHPGGATQTARPAGDKPNASSTPRTQPTAERTQASSDAPNLTSAASFSAARITSGKDAGKLWISEYGVPRWTKNVFYAVRERKDEPPELVRWEIPLEARVDNRIPQVVTFPSIVSATTQHVVLHNLARPNSTIRDVVGYHSNEWGGFDIGFLRRKAGYGEESKVYKNPNQEADPSGQLDATQLVDVKLAISQELSGRTEFYSISFRVMPRY